MATFTPAQNARAFYSDGTESGSVIIGSQDTDIVRTVNSDDNILIRVRIQETGAKAGATTDDWQFQVSKNGGAFANVTSVSSNVKSFASGNTTDQGATTNRLGAGSGSFVAGLVSEDGLADNLQLTASNFTEFLYDCTIVAADVANLDALTFRTLINAGTMTYNVTPKITVAKNIVITPPSAVLTVTGNAPSLKTNIGRSPGSAVLTVTGNAPSLVLNTVLVPASGTLTVTGNAPTITVSLNLFITVPSAVLTATGVAPSLVLNTILSPASGVITFSADAPTLTISAPAVAAAATTDGPGTVKWGKRKSPRRLKRSEYTSQEEYGRAILMAAMPMPPIPEPEPIDTTDEDDDELILHAVIMRTLH